MKYLSKAGSSSEHSPQRKDQRFLSDAMGVIRRLGVRGQRSGVTDMEKRILVSFVK